MYKGETDPLLPVFWAKVERRIYDVVGTVAKSDELEWTQNDVRNLVRNVANSKRLKAENLFRGVAFPASWLLEVKTALNSCAHGDGTLTWDFLRRSVEVVAEMQKAVEKALPFNRDFAWLKEEEAPSVATGNPLLAGAMKETDLLKAFDVLFGKYPGNRQVFGSHSGSSFSVHQVHAKEEGKETSILQHGATISNLTYSLQDVGTISHLLDVIYALYPESVTISHNQAILVFKTKEETDSLVRTQFRYRGIGYAVHSFVRQSSEKEDQIVIRNLPPCFLKEPFSTVSALLHVAHALEVEKCEVVGTDLQVTLDKKMPRNSESMNRLKETGLVLRANRYEVEVAKTRPKESGMDRQIIIKNLPPQLAGRENATQLKEHLEMSCSKKIVIDDRGMEYPEDRTVTFFAKDPAALCDQKICHRQVPLDIKRVHTKVMFLLEVDKSDVVTPQMLQVNLKLTTEFELLWESSSGKDLDVKCFSTLIETERLDSLLNQRAFSYYKKPGVIVTESEITPYPLVVTIQQFSRLGSPDRLSEDVLGAMFSKATTANFAVALSGSSLVAYANDEEHYQKLLEEGKIWVSNVESAPQKVFFSKNRLCHLLTLQQLAAPAETNVSTARPTHNTDQYVHFSVEVPEEKRILLSSFSQIKSFLMAMMNDTEAFVQVAALERTKAARLIAKHNLRYKEISTAEAEKYFFWSLTCTPGIPVHKIKEFREELVELTGEPWVAVKMQGKVLYTANADIFCMLSSLKERKYKFGTYEFGLSPSETRWAVVSQPFKNLHLVYFRKTSSVLERIARDHGCSVYVPFSEKRLASKTKTSNVKRLESTSVVFYLGFGQTDPEGPKKASSELHETFESLREVTSYLRFEDANLASACREKHIWPLSVDNAMNAVVMCRLEGTSTLLVTIFGEREEVSKVNQTLSALPASLVKRKYEPYLQESQLLAIQNKSLYVVPRSPNQQFSIVVGTTEDLDEFTASLGTVSTTLGREITKFYNFSPKEKYKAFMELHREFVANPNGVVVSWDHTKSTLRLKGDRANVTAVSQFIDKKLNAMFFYSKCIFIDEDCSPLLNLVLQDVPRHQIEPIEEKGPKAKLWLEEFKKAKKPQMRKCYHLYAYDLQPLQNEEEQWTKLNFFSKKVKTTLRQFHAYQTHVLSSNYRSLHTVNLSFLPDDRMLVKGFYERHVLQERSSIEGFVSFFEDLEHVLQIRSKNAKHLYAFMTGLPNWTRRLEWNTELSRPVVVSWKSNCLTVKLTGALDATRRAEQVIFAALEDLATVPVETNNLTTQSFSSIRRKIASIDACLYADADSWLDESHLVAVGRENLNRAAKILDERLSEAAEKVTASPDFGSVGAVEIFRPTQEIVHLKRTGKLWDKLLASDSLKSIAAEVPEVHCFGRSPVLASASVNGVEIQVAKSTEREENTEFIAKLLPFNELDESGAELIDNTFVGTGASGSNARFFYCFENPKEDFRSLVESLLSVACGSCSSVTLSDAFFKQGFVDALVTFLNGMNSLTNLHTIRLISESKSSLSEIVGQLQRIPNVDVSYVDGSRLEPPSVSHRWYGKDEDGVDAPLPDEIGRMAESYFLENKIKVVTESYEIDFRKMTFKQRNQQINKKQEIKRVPVGRKEPWTIWQVKMGRGWTDLEHNDLIEHAFRQKLAVKVRLPSYGNGGGGNFADISFQLGSCFGKRENGGQVFLRRLNVPMTRVLLRAKNCDGPDSCQPSVDSLSLSFRRAIEDLVVDLSCKEIRIPLASSPHLVGEDAVRVLSDRLARSHPSFVLTLDRSTKEICAKGIGNRALVEHLLREFALAPDTPKEMVLMQPQDALLFRTNLKPFSRTGFHLLATSIRSTRHINLLFTRLKNGHVGEESDFFPNFHSLQQLSNTVVTFVLELFETFSKSLDATERPDAQRILDRSFELCQGLRDNIKACTFEAIDAVHLVVEENFRQSVAQKPAKGDAGGKKKGQQENPGASKDFNVATLHGRYFLKYLLTCTECANKVFAESSESFLTESQKITTMIESGKKLNLSVAGKDWIYLESGFFASHAEPLLETEVPKAGQAFDPVHSGIEPQLQPYRIARTAYEKMMDATKTLSIQNPTSPLVWPAYKIRVSI